jgi:ABC-type spermidine/putrescine transport system permease subunit II
MPPNLVPCARCRRHVRGDASRCPFCSFGASTFVRALVSVAAAAAATASLGACSGAPPKAKRSHEHTLELDEFRTIVTAFARAAERVNLPVHAGTGWLTLRGAIERTRIARDVGIRAVQVVPPFWVPVNDFERIEFYRALAEAVPDVGILVYNTERIGKILGAAQIQALAAAVPSIVFGLLGLAVFIGFFGLPRSAPLVGALVLTLLTLPTIIIASRAALKGVPPSIREAALSMGASKIQTVAHHVLPLAMPGMLTGAIIGMARALGETAPLLMIGMVAFIVDVPKGLTDPATVLPVQVFLWSDSPERGFVEKTSGAIIVLLAFLVVMNTTAVILRKRFERRW